MESEHCDIWNKRISQFVIIPSVVLALITGGCSTPLKLAEAHKNEDVLFLV